MNQHPPLSEDEARVALARVSNKGGGYAATRMDGGWLFTPILRPGAPTRELSWVVADTRNAAPLDEPGVPLRTIIARLTTSPWHD